MDGFSKVVAHVITTAIAITIVILVKSVMYTLIGLSVLKALGVEV